MRTSFYLAILAIVASETSAVKLNASFGFGDLTAGLGAAGGLAGGLGVPVPDELGAATSTLQAVGTGDPAAIANASVEAAGNIAGAVDPNAQQIVQDLGTAGVNTGVAAGSGDAQGALNAAGGGVAGTTAAVTGNEQIAQQIVGATAMGAQATSTLIDANGNPVNIVQGVSEIGQGIGAGVGGQTGADIANSSVGAGTMGTQVVNQDYAGAAQTGLQTSSDVAATYNPELAANLGTAAPIAGDLVTAGQQGQYGDMVNQASQGTAVFVQDPNAAAAIAGYGANAGNGITAGMDGNVADGITTALVDANLTTAALYGDQPAAQQAQPNVVYVDQNGNILPDQQQAAALQAQTDLQAQQAAALQAQQQADLQAQQAAAQQQADLQAQQTAAQAQPQTVVVVADQTQAQPTVQPNTIVSIIP